MYNNILRVVAVVFTTSIVMSCNIDDSAVRQRNFKKMLGSYIIDLTKTDLGSYKNDADSYKNLTITFTNDAMFHLNQSVPFLSDTIGFWKAKGVNIEEWNKLSYISWGNFREGDPDRFDQFSGIGPDDETFYINSPTSKTSWLPLSVIYFKKIK